MIDITLEAIDRAEFIWRVHQAELRAQAWLNREIRECEQIVDRVLEKHEVEVSK